MTTEPVPMRVSVQRADRAYRSDGAYFLVYLNGARLDYCVTADVAECLVVCDVLDEHGRPTRINGRRQLRTIYGQVCIEDTRTGQRQPPRGNDHGENTAHR